MLFLYNQFFEHFESAVLVGGFLPEVVYFQTLSFVVNVFLLRLFLIYFLLKVTEVVGLVEEVGSEDVRFGRLCLSLLLRVRKTFKL